MEKRGLGGKKGRRGVVHFMSIKKHTFLPQYPKFIFRRWKIKKMGLRDCFYVHVPFGKIGSVDYVEISEPPLTTLAKTAPNSYWTITLGLFQSYVSHIGNKCQYHTNMSSTYMAGSSQPQQFFASGCLFANFESPCLRLPLLLSLIVFSLLKIHVFMWL